MLPTTPAGPLASGSVRDSWSVATQASAPAIAPFGTALVGSRLDPRRLLVAPSSVQNTVIDEVQSESPLLFAFDMAEIPEQERGSAGLTVSAPMPGPPEAETYRLPLHQAAERGDLVRLIDLPGTVFVPATGFAERNGNAPRNLPPHAVIPASSASSSCKSQAGRFARLGRTLLPVAATWAILQGIYAGMVRTPDPQSVNRRGKSIDRA
jgi:hypothetical protein